MSSITFTPGPTPCTVRAADGKIITVPDGWVLVPPGDAALTRRIKAAGEHFAIAEKKGRKVFSRGISPMALKPLHRNSPKMDSGTCSACLKTPLWLKPVRGALRASVRHAEDDVAATRDSLTRY